MCGCAAIAGIDQFSEGPCAGGDCDGAVGVDGNADVIKQGDSTGGQDQSVDQSVDQSAGDVVQQDVGTTSDASDSGQGNDSGCGPTNTITNCSACGLACDVVHSNGPVCNGVTCGYTSCHSGYSDCNTGAPDTDGCECATPSCCGSSCATTHSNGLGTNYYDCTAKSTFNSTQATEACGAYTGNQATCTTLGCTGPGSNQVVCGTTGGICACWNYSGSNVGHVTTSTNTTCYCPASSDPSWN
jgi:hypothetical protein